MNDKKSKNKNEKTRVKMEDDLELLAFIVREHPILNKKVPIWLEQKVKAIAARAGTPNKS